MISTSLLELAKILNAKLIGEDRKITKVAIDTRKVSKNCLFLALKGKHFDAHNFTTTALAAGASALLVSHYQVLDIPQLVVEDTRLALGKIAAWLRQYLETCIVALTGSSGKTSVKEMTASILSECGEVLCTEGNLNNDIGVPMTLLRLKPQHDFAVIELGANHVGEIAYTSSLTRPCSALINNLAASHLEGFGSFQRISEAKGEIFTALTDNGVAIINDDNNDWSLWKGMLTGKTVWRFSLDYKKGVEFFPSNIKSNRNSTSFQLNSPLGFTEIKLPIRGRHNIANALAASALSISVGASLSAVRHGLNKFQPLPGRMFPIILADKKLLLDDSYNANVGSMTAALEALSERPGYRVMVAGEMAELGMEEEECYRQVGCAARLAGIDKVITVGSLNRVLSKEFGSGEHYQEKASVIKRVLELLNKHKVITVLIKGSRLSAMEHIVSSIKEKSPC